ncbi:separin protein [Coemansia sp. RSA 1972]|nr:separin protein [Coemansia sp. RSA 1972]
MASDLLVALNDITTCTDQTETTALERLSTSTKGARSSIEFALAVVNQSNHLLTKHALAIRHQVESSNTQCIERITRVTLAAFQYLHTHRTQAGFNVLSLEKTLSNYTIACTNAHLGHRVWDALGVLRTLLLEHARTHTNSVSSGSQGTASGSTRSVRKPASRAKKDIDVEQTAKSKGRPTAKQAANAKGRPTVAATLTRGMNRLSINPADNEAQMIGPTRFPIEHCKDGLAFNVLVATMLCNILRVLAQAPAIAREHVAELALRPHSALDWCTRVQATDAQAMDPLLSACFRAYYTLGSIDTQHSLSIRLLSICAYSQTTACDLRELLKYSSRAAARIEPTTASGNVTWQSVDKFYAQVWDGVRVRMEAAQMSPEVVEFSHQWAQARRRAGDTSGSLTVCRIKVSGSAVTKLVSGMLAIGCCMQSMVDSNTVYAEAGRMSGGLPSLTSAALDKGARYTLAEWNALALCADIARKTAKSAQTELNSSNVTRVCDSVSQALASLLEASCAIYEAYVVRGAAAKAEGSGGTSVSTLRNHGAEVRVLLIQITLQYRDSDALAQKAVDGHSKWLLAACAAKTCNADYLRNHSAVFFNRGASLYQLKMYARAAQATEMAITSLVQWTELAQPASADKVVEQVCKRFEVAALSYQSDRQFDQAFATYARAVEWIIGRGEIAKSVVCPNAGPRPPGSSMSEKSHVTWILQFVDRYVRMCAGRLAVDPSEPACLVSLQSKMIADMVISGWLYEAEAWSWRPFTALASSSATTSAVRARAAHLQSAAQAYESCAPVAYARCVVELAKIARDQGDLTECEDRLHAAMEVAKSQQDSVYVLGVLAECYAWQAVVRIEAGGSEANSGDAEVKACTRLWALMHSLDVESSTSDSGYFSTVVELMQQVAELLQSRRRFTQAADILRVAVDMATQCELSNPSWAVCTMECMVSLALSHMHEGNAAAASQHIRNAASRYETGVLPVTVEIASLASFALCELASGDTNAGARTLESAESLARMSWDAVAKQRHSIRRPKADASTLALLATTSHVYAKLALKRGMLADAIDFGVHAYRVLNSLLSSLSMARKRMTQNNDDDPFSDKDDAVKEDAEDDTVFAGNWQLQRLLLDVLVNLAEMYAVRGSTKEAEYFLQKAMDVARALRAPLPTAYVQVVEADVVSRKSMQVSALRENVTGASVGDSVRALLVEGDSLRRSGDYEGAHKAYARAIRFVEGGDARESLLDVTPRLQRILGQTGPRSVVSSNVKTSVPAVVREDIAIRQQLTTLLSVLADDSNNTDAVGDAEPAAGRSMDQQPTHQLLQCSVAFADLQRLLSLDSAFEPILRSSLMLPSLRVARTQRPRKGSPGARVRDQLLALNTQLTDTIRISVSVGSSHVVHEASHMLALVRAMLTALGFAQLSGVERIVDDCRNVTVAREVVDARRRRDREPVALSVWPEDVVRQGAERQDSRVNSPTASPVLRARGASVPVLGDLALDTDDLEADLGIEFQRAVDGDHVVSAWETGPTDSFSSELPPSWIVCGLSIDQARNMLIVTRYALDHEPLTLCLPMRPVCSGDVSIDTPESRSVFDDAHDKLRAIIRESDRTMKTGAACATEREKRAWWEHRAALDKQLGVLVESVEDEWLGALRHVLDPTARVSAPDVRELCTSVEKCMVAGLSKSFATKARTMELAPELCLAVQCVAQRRSAAHAESDWMDVCALVWDVYFFQGAAPAGTDEALTEFADRLCKVMAELVDAETEQVDGGPMHVVLVLDKHAQQIPWESLPTLRKYSVSRVPSLAFLRSRMASMRLQKPMSALSPNLTSSRGSIPLPLNASTHGDRVDGSHLFYVLNPEGDLLRTQAGFEEFVCGGPSTWHGCVGRRPTHAEVEHGLQTGVFVYFGHGGAEAYVARSCVRAQKCTVALLMGCSSGRLEWAGEFDALGTATDYMVGGSMAVVGNLWDVGDKDIDRFAACVVAEWGLNEYSTGEVKIKQDVDQGRGRVSLAEAVCKARNACRMKYLTGAAPVVYGIPVYLE